MIYWLIGLAGVGYALTRGGRMIMPYALSLANAAKFLYGLPAQTRPYAADLWDAGKKYGIDPFILAGIMERESISGAALYPKGPSGTGDWTARPPGWSIAKHGKIVTKLPLTDGVQRWMPHPSLPNGPFYIPLDEKGWGRGLMQIDEAVHYDWLHANDWTNPKVLIDKAAKELSANLALMAKGGLKGSLLVHAAVSGYNVAPSTALADARAGRSPDANTTGKNYARDTTGAGMGVLDRADRFQKASGILNGGAVAGLSGLDLQRHPATQRRIAAAPEPGVDAPLLSVPNFQGLGDDKSMAREVRQESARLILPYRPAAGRIGQPRLQVPRFRGPGGRPPGSA